MTAAVPIGVADRVTDMLAVRYQFGDDCGMCGDVQVTTASAFNRQERRTWRTRASALRRYNVQ